MSRAVNPSARKLKSKLKLFILSQLQARLIKNATNCKREDRHVRDGVSCKECVSFAPKVVVWWKRSPSDSTRCTSNRGSVLCCWAVGVLHEKAIKMHKFNQHSKTQHVIICSRNQIYFNQPTIYLIYLILPILGGEHFLIYPPFCECSLLVSGVQFFKPVTLIHHHEECCNMGVHNNAVCQDIRCWLVSCKTSMTRYVCVAKGLLL